MSECLTYGKRPFDTIFRVCNRLQSAVDEALEAPAKLTKLNHESQKIIHQESEAATWEMSCITTACIDPRQILETWWRQGTGTQLKAYKEDIEVEAPLIAGLTAFLSLLEYLELINIQSHVILPMPLANSLIQACSGPLIQLAQQISWRKITSDEMQGRQAAGALYSLSFLCLAKINALCSIQESTDMGNCNSRRCSIAPLSDFLANEMLHLFSSCQIELCHAVMASFEISLHSSIAFRDNCVWRTGFKPCLQQVANMALQFSLDAASQTCEKRHALAITARRTLCFLTWRNICGTTSLESLPQTAPGSAHEWALTAAIGSCQAHISSIQAALTQKYANSSVMMEDVETMQEMSGPAQILPDAVTQPFHREKTLSRSTADILLSIHHVQAALCTFKSLMELGGNVQSTNAGEEAFGHIRFQGLECGSTILKLDTTALWPLLKQAAVVLVSLVRHSVTLSIKPSLLQSFFANLCEVLSSIILTLPPTKIAMFSGPLIAILCTLMVNYDSIIVAAQVLSLSRGSLARLLTVLTSRAPSLLLSRIESRMNEEAPNVANGQFRWSSISTRRVYVYEQLNYSIFSILKQLRMDIVDPLKVGVPTRSRDTASLSTVEAIARLYQQSAPSKEDTQICYLLIPSVKDALKNLFIELFSLVGANRHAAIAYADHMTISAADDELEIIWFLFRGLESVNNTKGSALVYKNIGLMFQPNKTQSRESNVQLGCTLAWLHLILHTLTDNESAGFLALLKVVQNVLGLEKSALATFLKASKISPFLNAIGTLLYRWQREFTDGFLNRKVSAQCLELLNTLIAEINSRLSSAPKIEDMPDIPMSSQRTVCTLSASYGDVLASLCESLRDAWHDQVQPQSQTLIAPISLTSSFHRSGKGPRYLDSIAADFEDEDDDDDNDEENDNDDNNIDDDDDNDEDDDGGENTDAYQDEDENDEDDGDLFLDDTLRHSSLTSYDNQVAPAGTATENMNDSSAITIPSSGMSSPNKNDILIQTEDLASTPLTRSTQLNLKAVCDSTNTVMSLQSCSEKKDSMSEKNSIVPSIAEEFHMQGSPIQEIVRTEMDGSSFVSASRDLAKLMSPTCLSVPTVDTDEEVEPKETLESHVIDDTSNAMGSLVQNLTNSVRSETGQTTETILDTTAITDHPSSCLWMSPAVKCLGQLPGSPHKDVSVGSITTEFSTVMEESGAVPALLDKDVSNLIFQSSESIAAKSGDFAALSDDKHATFSAGQASSDQMLDLDTCHTIKPISEALTPFEHTAPGAIPLDVSVTGQIHSTVESNLCVTEQSTIELHSIEPSDASRPAFEALSCTEKPEVAMSTNIIEKPCDLKTGSPLPMSITSMALINEDPVLTFSNVWPEKTPKDQETNNSNEEENNDLDVPPSISMFPSPGAYGPLSPSTFDSTLLETNEYLDNLVRSHDISDDE